MCALQSEKAKGICIIKTIPQLRKKIKNCRAVFVPNSMEAEKSCIGALKLQSNICTKLCGGREELHRCQMKPDSLIINHSNMDILLKARIYALTNFIDRNIIFHVES